MAKNIVSKASNNQEERHPWYPNLSNKYRNQNFIYLDTLQDDNPKLFYNAENRFHDVLGKLNLNLSLQLHELLALAEREQEKEDRLLDDFFGTTAGSPREDAKRIQAFNDIYQSKEIFERNLKKIRAVAEDNSKKGRIDITTNFKGYLETSLADFLSKHSLEELTEANLMEVTKEALIKAFESNDEDRGSLSTDEKHSYQELAEIISYMESRDPFIEEVFNLYLKDATDKLKKELSKVDISSTKKRKLAKALITGSTTVHGDLLEAVSALIIESISAFSGQGQIHKTGKTKQKADIITLFEANFEIPEMLFDNAEGGSVREQFIKRFEQFYKKLEDQSGHIVEISAKNYNITDKHFRDKGFTAQSETSILNFEKMLKAYRYDKKRTDDLIFALTNIGPDTLASESQTEIISHSISLLIGYFLFDDLDMDIGLKVNAIHLFNLDGIYIPLSSFLFAAYETLQDLEKLSSDMVSVDYKPKSVDYKRSQEGDWLTRSKWIATVDKKQTESVISVHFFKQFPRYVSERLK